MMYDIASRSAVIIEELGIAFAVINYVYDYMINF